MLTLKFKISVSEEDKIIIDKHQLEYSCAFRKIYNNLDLTKDKNYEKEVRNTHGLNSKMYEYIVGEAETWFKKREIRCKQLKDRIKRLKKDLIKAKNHRKFKINEKIHMLEKAIKRDYTFGSIELAKELSKNPKEEKLRYEWKDKRKYMMIMQGETASYGNRFFDFSELKNGIVYYKPNRNIRIKMMINIKGGKRKDIVNDLQNYAMVKSLPLTCKLSSNEIHISYDETIINNKKFEEKKIRKELKKLNLCKEEYKNRWREEYVKHYEKILKDKIKHRYCGLDLNPDGIGVIIADKLKDTADIEPTIIHKEFISFKDLNTKLKLSSSDKRQIKQNNKRKYEISCAVKHIFKMIKHYNVAYFITEELDFSKSENDLGNKKVNRYVNNLWCRTLLNRLFTKYTNINGLKWIQVNPAYSSFIGNIKYKLYDPVAAALEITRRGQVKYMKGGSIFPRFNRSFLTSDLLENLNLSNEMLGKLKVCSTFKEIYSYLSAAKKSVRRKSSKYLNGFIANNLGNVKSKVKIYS